jgi:hypothetical protein
MGVYACADLTGVYTKDGQRLFVDAVLRDWSGWVPVSFLDSCAITLLQCSSKEEVEQKMADRSLSVTSGQLNVRGVKVGFDYHIVQISLCESFVEPTKTALRLADLASLCGPNTDGMVTCAAAQLTRTNLLNLAVSIENHGIIAPYRVVLLLEGTEKSQLIRKAGTSSASRIIVSKKAKCLLSTSPTTVTLRAYASEDMLLDYKLDRCVAVVRVIAIHKENDEVTCVVDRMEPLTNDTTEKQKAIRYTQVMQQLSTSPRTLKDLKRAVEFVTPDSMKKARSVRSYPSDPI